MESIATRILFYKKQLEVYGGELIAVSKMNPVNKLLEAYNAGQRHFGENKVQEMTEKAASMPSDVKWHMIGHLQRNKVKFIVPYVYMIHSVDSDKLLAEIDKEARKCSRKIPCLLQIHVAREETKFGFSESEILDYLYSHHIVHYENINVQGLMTMASNTDDKSQIAKEFKQVKEIFDRVKREVHAPNVQMNYLSMGMSSDYEIALTYGSHFVRIGSAIFGARDTPTKSI